jgi:hypothetical protein
MTTIHRALGRITTMTFAVACLAGSASAPRDGSTAGDPDVSTASLTPTGTNQALAARRKKTGGAGSRRRTAADKPTRKPARVPHPRVVSVPDSDDLDEPAVEVGPAEGAAARLTGGDVDADLARAASSGEEAVGGSASTPDQDQVDAIGQALGVERASTAEVVSSAEMLEGRDRRRWRGERASADEGAA